MVMTNVAEGRGPSVRCIILLTSAGCLMSVLIADWLAGMVIRVPRMRRGPHQLALPLPPTTYQLTNHVSIQPS